MRTTLHTLARHNIVSVGLASARPMIEYGVQSNMLTRSRRPCRHRRRW